MASPRSTRTISAAQWARASSEGFATMRTDFGGHPRYPSSPGRPVPHTPLAARLGSPSSPRSHHNVQLAPLGAAQQYARANTVVSGPPASKQSPVAYDIFGRRSALAPAPFERAMTPGRSVIRHSNHGEKCSTIHSGLRHHQSALRCLCAVSHPNGYVDSALFSPSAKFTTQVGRPAFGRCGTRNCSFSWPRER